MEPTRIVVWNERRQDRGEEAVRAVYPHGIHAPIVAHFNAKSGFSASAATLDEPEHGLPAERLRKTDVLIWWGHRAHHEVDEQVVDRIERRVREGMGLIVLHSAHFSKIFERLMGTSCRLHHWKVNGGWERLWPVDPEHPIARGLPYGYEIPIEEMYAEPFAVPPPDELVFLSSFQSGEVFRSGAVWRRDRGKIFYFRPGHETYPVYHDPVILDTLVRAAEHVGNAPETVC